MKTAVEWVEEIAMNGFITPEDFEQAKEMEKQQIMDAWHGGCKTAEQYYNETYKNKEE